MDINNKILEKLKELQQKEGALPQYLELYKQLLLIQVGGEENATPSKPSLTKDKIGSKLRKGIPILEWDALSLSIDWVAFPQLFRKAAACISKYIEPPPKDSIAFDIATLQEVTKAWYECSSLSTWANDQSISEEALTAMIHCAIKPFLRAQANALLKVIDQEQWRRGYCPVCSGKPDFAFLDKERGARWLLCSRCDTEWLFQRLECPYCSTTDHKELAYFADDKELYRLYICQKCHTYLKAIDLRKTEAEILLPLERVLTADLDRQGQEKGYKGG